MKFSLADDVRNIASMINNKLQMGVDLDKVVFIRSYGSKTKAYARTFSLPSQWRYVLETNTLYIVEVISERYDSLSCQDKAYVLTHELMHIPSNMSGGLRNHSYSGFSKLKHLLRKLEIPKEC
ncbi:metallopeptidase [Metallosphaera hakonensis JCM 8857 = DSM 7519]|uniref:Metallopeptidase n=1 Tax=Metallosphaera hakonensis JCM 8857 = DSM 7519 TaxID=1293036 RepID=A0A2U9IX41_9CREN|nr:metallopeptidase [Metallosphaera hakonensis JCM 8857 = DSM 7519]